MYGRDGRVAYKGKIFSAPMDWDSMVEQFKKIEKQETNIVLPATGELLASRVRIAVASGLVDLNALLKQATVRRHIVVQLISMHRDAGHPDYNVDMKEVKARAQKIATTDEPTIPSGLRDFLDPEDGMDVPFLGVDKAATPAERNYNIFGLQKELDRARPLLLMTQRDSDACKDVSASRIGAFANFSELELVTGSNLIDQFETSYIPRVFNMTLPWCVGGPDFPQQRRYRRTFADSPRVSLHDFDVMMASRCEAQIRQYWELSPGLRSLSFATKVNQGVSMSINRA